MSKERKSYKEALIKQAQVPAAKKLVSRDLTDVHHLLPVPPCLLLIGSDELIRLWLLQLLLDYKTDLEA